MKKTTFTICVILVISAIIALLIFLFDGFVGIFNRFFESDLSHSEVGFILIGVAASAVLMWLGFICIKKITRM